MYMFNLFHKYQEGCHNHGVATRTLLEADTSRAKRRQVVDQIAASYILQGFLDRLHHMANQSPGAVDGAKPDHGEDR